MYRKEVDRNNLRTFGQRVMVHIYKDNRNPDKRWAPRAQEARIIGYIETHGVYQAITVTGKRIDTTKDPIPIKGEPKPEPEPEAVSLPKQPKITKPIEPRRSTRSGRDNRPYDQREK